MRRAASRTVAGDAVPGRGWLPACLVALILLPACKPVGPDYGGAPEVKLAGRFFGSRDSRPDPKLDKWWQRLGSSKLNKLVERALDNNHDIAIAAQRLRESRAMRKQAAGAFLPQAGANLSFERLDFGGLLDDSSRGALSDSGLISNPLDYWSTGFDVSWELDVFGGRRRQVRGARAREEAAREALYGARLAIAAEVAETYCTLAGLREQAGEVKGQVALQQKQTSDMEDRVVAGAASNLDLDRTRARLETTRAALPRLEAGIISQQRRLALLIGGAPGALDGTGVASETLPTKLPMVRTGLPAELVLRRPDLRGTERDLAAAAEDIGVAVAEFYPKFSIGGGPSGFGSSFGDLFNASNYIWQYGPRVDWSVFKGGSNRAALEAANARAKAALLSYEKAVLAAVGEVEIELARLRAETGRLAIVQRARAATEAAVKRVVENHESGASDYVEVLIEEERLREIAITEIRSKSQMLQVWVHLHKALGGGWE